MDDAGITIWQNSAKGHHALQKTGIGSMEPFAFGNTILPVALLLALAVFLPVLTVPPRVMTQLVLLRGMVGAIALQMVLGALIFAELYRREGNDVLSFFFADPVGQSQFFLSRALLSGMFWGPIIAFVWFGRALEVERRKGEAKAREGRLS